MKTTIELPDSLLRRAKVASAQRNITLKQMMIEGLEKALAEREQPSGIELSEDDLETFRIDERGVPVLKKRKTPRSKQFLAQIEAIRNDLDI